MSEIGLGIRSKQTSGSYVRLTLTNFNSTMDELNHNELIHMLHALSRTKYVDTTIRQQGFPYTFPIVFGY